MFKILIALLVFSASLFKANAQQSFIGYSKKDFLESSLDKSLRPTEYKNGTYSYSYSYDYVYNPSENLSYEEKVILNFNKDNKCYKQIHIAPVETIYEKIKMLDKNLLKIGKMKWENVPLGIILELRADGKYVITTIYKSS